MKVQIMVQGGKWTVPQYSRGYWQPVTTIWEVNLAYEDEVTIVNLRDQISVVRKTEIDIPSTNEIREK